MSTQIAHIAGIDNTITVQPTLDTSAYASGDRLGSIHTITNAFREFHRPFGQTTPGVPTIALGGNNILAEITIIDQAKQSAAIDILFFDKSPTVASADNAAIDISDAE